jgi:bifunctional non-homologous end joining protein LigD
VRARAGPPVALPLAGKDLATLKRADAFRLADLKAGKGRLRADPWKTMSSSAAPLPSLAHARLGPRGRSRAR